MISLCRNCPRGSSAQGGYIRQFKGSRSTTFPSKTNLSVVVLYGRLDVLLGIGNDLGIFGVGECVGILEVDHGERYRRRRGPNLDAS
jgi:hypothetical protein